MEDCLREEAAINVIYGGWLKRNCSTDIERCSTDFESVAQHFCEFSSRVIKKLFEDTTEGVLRNLVKLLERFWEKKNCLLFQILVWRHKNKIISNYALSSKLDYVDDWFIDSKFSQQTSKIPQKSALKNPHQRISQWLRSQSSCASNRKNLFATLKLRRKKKLICTTRNPTNFVNCKITEKSVNFC